MNFLKHMINQPFIFATGVAALIHSTWSLGTLFAGNAPSTFSAAWWGWLIPAFLIAFAMDVGQISTSAQIRKHGMTFWRFVTFAVFALATWYLQWLYIAHHMPELALAPGIGEIHRAAALSLRDMAMWIIPALLPLSTLLYTFSSDREQQIETIELQPDAFREITPPGPEIAATNTDFAQLAEGLPHVATCDVCGWKSVAKDSDLSATRALAAHKIHCTAKHRAKHNGNGLVKDMFASPSYMLNSKNVDKHD